MRAPSRRILRFPVRRGMGTLDYYGLLAQANLQACDPKDVVCVASNVSKQAAVEDYWSQHQATGVPDGTVLNFTPITNQQVQQFLNNVVPTGVLQVSSPVLQPAPAPPAPAVQPVVNPSPAAQPATTGSSVTSPTSVTSVASGGAAPTTLLTSTVGGYVASTTTTAADWIAGIPNSAVLMVGGVAVLLLMLGRGR